MAQYYNPKITTENLVLSLDPSHNKSYPAIDLPVKGGLALWLDAADDTTFSYSSGTVVSQWRDKSGNNFHASQLTVASQPNRNTIQNSRKTVNFDGTNDTVTIPNFSCNSEMSIFVVSNCGTTLFIEHSTDANSNQGFYFYGGGNGMIYITRSTGTLIYNTNWLSGGYSIASAVNSTGLDLLTYKNGTQQTITTDNRSAVTNSYVTTTLYIGSRGANSVWTAGPIAEIIIYNRKVTNAERNLIHTYLGQKWGIFNTDRQIFDLSGNNYNFSFNGSNPRYNAKSIVSNFNTTSPYAVSSFGGQNLTNTILNLLYVDHTIEVAVNLKGFKAVKSFDNPRDYEGGAGIVLWQGYHGGLYVDSVTQKLTYLIWNSDPTNVYIEYALPNDLKDKILYITAKRQANVLSIFINGVLVAGPANITTTVRSYTQINIGAAFQGDPSSGSLGAFVWAGQHEYHLLRMYNKALSASEIVSNYQAFKARFDNNIVRFGLILDLDAGNPYSYAGTGTTWYDVSGNGYNGILSGGPTYSTTNGGILNLDGLDDHCFSTVASIPASSTVAIWIKSSAYSGNKIPISIDGDSYGSGPNIYFSESKINWNTGDGAANAFTNSSYPDSNWHYIVVTNDSSTNAKLYIDGTLIGTASYRSTLSTVTSNFWIGKFHAGGYEIAASIGQVQLYNRALSTAEVLQNYNATKGRFGL